MGEDKNNLLSDGEYNRVHMMEADEYSKLGDDLKAKYERTANWHFKQRVSGSKQSVGDLLIDGVPAEEFSAYRRMVKGQIPAPVSTSPYGIPIEDLPNKSNANIEMSVDGSGQLKEVMVKLEEMSKQIEQNKAEAQRQLAVIPKQDDGMMQAIQQLAMIVKEVAGRQQQAVVVNVPEHGADVAQSILALAEAVKDLAARPVEVIMPKVLKTTKTFTRDREGLINSPVVEKQEFE